MPIIVPFYLKQAQKVRGDVLEVACGTGRITIPLAKSGIKITGLDISGSMLDHAKLKAQRENVEIPWFQSDCRKFDLKKKFALIFIVFNSMQHLHDRESLEEFFQCVHQHILSSGLFYS